MLPALVCKHQTSQRLASWLPSSTCSLWCHWQQHTAHFAAAAAPSILSPSSLAPAPSSAAAGPASTSMVVQYPFEIEYYSPRRALMYDLNKQPLAAVELPGDVFNVPVRIDILHEVVKWQRAKARQGTHKTKDRSEVRGGGKKPWPQKGSGRARQGSRRAPHWRGGGTVHGPVPRSYAYALPKKVRRLGLKCALSAKANEGRLVLVNSLKPDSPKTKHMLAKLQKLLEGQPRMSVLLMDASTKGKDGGDLMRRASRNIPGVEIVPAVGANVYSILRRDVLVMTQPAVDAVVQRLRRPINRLGAAGLVFQQKLQQRRQQLAKQRQLQAQQQQLDLELGGLSGQQQRQQAGEAAASSSS